ncbi:hypothetical protein MSAN_02005300 [Mycena sanguinolenta]|uniref:DUF6534 domain-containing protein n=1 Tax=Mycena sanguinolenta TaxID=230812 RepID=A0A8H6XM28_9AGAR|nr:hypothetical protein MSAN_02005300 [Mycena sanguinolenta]
MNPFIKMFLFDSLPPSYNVCPSSVWPYSKRSTLVRINGDLFLLAAYTSTPAMAPLLIGTLLNMILFGVLVTQHLTYFQAFRKDRLWMRVLVWGVFTVETANTGFAMYMIFQPLILNYGVFPLCVLVVAFPIQLFFLWRIRALTGNNFLPAIILLFALVSLGGGIWTTVMVPIVAKFENIPRLYRSAEVWLIAAAVTDLCIAVSLALALRRKKTGFTSTDSVVDKIIRSALLHSLLCLLHKSPLRSFSDSPNGRVDVGSHRAFSVPHTDLTYRALFSILDVVCFLTFKGDTINFMWNIPLSKLYANCLLSTLNARRSLNRRMDGRSIDSSGRQANVVLTNTNIVGALGADSKMQDPTPSNDDTMLTDEESHHPFGGIRMTKIVERV